MPAKFKMLVLDDDPAMVRLLRKVIDREFGDQLDQLDLTDLTDPVEARKWIEENAPDIVLTDLEMPQVSGLEILRCSKRRNVRSQVLLLTGHSNTESLLDALELGAIDYLIKPVDQQELTELLTHSFARITRWKNAMRETIRH